MIDDKATGVRGYLSYEDARYPDLILQSDKFGSVGYSLNLDSGDLTRVCICAAHHSIECCCGAWDKESE